MCPFYVQLHMFPHGESLHICKPSTAPPRASGSSEMIHRGLGSMRTIRALEATVGSFRCGLFPSLGLQSLCFLVPISRLDS
jgi:hypothetical protein